MTDERGTDLEEPLIVWEDRREGWTFAEIQERIAASNNIPVRWNWAIHFICAAIKEASSDRKQQCNEDDAASVGNPTDADSLEWLGEELTEYYASKLELKCNYAEQWIWMAHVKGRAMDESPSHARKMSELI